MSILTRLRLFFKRPYYCCDWGAPGDFAVVRKWKYLDGKMYLIEERITESRNR